MILSHKNIISVHGSHNASVAGYCDGKYLVVEVERWVNRKNSGLYYYLSVKNPDLVFSQICDYIMAQLNMSSVDVLITSFVPSNFTPNFDYKQKVSYPHHDNHAAGTFYQSSFNESLVISFDGGGDGDFFNIYHADRKAGLTLLEKVNYDMGFPYMIIGHFIKDIKQESIQIGNLVYPGKLMGICSLGKIRHEWTDALYDFYKSFTYDGHAFSGGMETAHQQLPILFNKLGLPYNFDKIRLEKQESWDLAATSQYVFEKIFLEFSEKYIKKYKNLCITGGCALNILNNSNVKNKFPDINIFVAPNTNDCGIAIGGILNYLKPHYPVDLTYSGVPILDEYNFSKLLNDNDFLAIPCDKTKLVECLLKRKIVGIIQGNSEHGSRALGNRSILCLPYAGMKDKINQQVKHREWYRPFAPVIREDFVNQFFVFPENQKSPHMTFVAQVSEYNEKIASIIHYDNTARLQTVSKNDNEFLYDLLTELYAHDGVGVLLNTSFNDNGKPILSRLEDAFSLMRCSELDAFFYNNTLITKKSFHEETPLNEKVTTNLFVLNNFIDGVIHKLEKFKNTENVCVICQRNNAREISRVLPNAKIHIIDKNRLYFSKYISDNNIEVSSNYIKILWMKEILNENIFNTGFHKFIDINAYEIELFIDRIPNSKTVSIFSNRMGTDLVFNRDKLKQRFGVTPLEGYPESSYFDGQVEYLKNLSNAFEAYAMESILETEQFLEDKNYLICATTAEIQKYEYFYAE